LFYEDTQGLIQSVLCNTLLQAHAVTSFISKAHLDFDLCTTQEEYTHNHGPQNNVQTQQHVYGSVLYESLSLKSISTSPFS